MIRFLAKIWAKLQYRWRQEVEASTHDLNASLALRTAEDKRAVASQLKIEADALDARIKQVSELEEKGYWLCENGHETDASSGNTAVDSTGQITLCASCTAPKKFIRRDLMTGQDKYESDKERNEAQKIADQKRAEAKTQEESSVESERAARYFRNLAQSNRNVAGKIRAL